jgi:hypothetical protein
MEEQIIEEEMQRIVIIVPAIRPKSPAPAEKAHTERTLKMVEYDFGCYLA